MTILNKIKTFFSLDFNKIFPGKIQEKENSFLVLCYHRILSREDNTNVIPSMVNSHPLSFEKTIEYLKTNFNIISPYELLNNCRLPKKSLIITFDDGYKDNYINAYPILKKYNIPAVIFLTTNFIDNNRDLIWTDKFAYLINNTKKTNIIGPDSKKYDISDRCEKEKVKISIMEKLKTLHMDEIFDFIYKLSGLLDVNIKNGVFENFYLSSNEILEMSKQNIIFGSHGCSHSILKNIDTDEVKNEIIKSKMKIENITEKEVVFFSYPNGTNRDFDDNVINILKTEGYKSAFTMISGRNYKTGSLDLFRLKRISAGKSLLDLRKNIFLYT